MEGENWNNCNNVTDKMYLKKEKNENRTTMRSSNFTSGYLSTGNKITTMKRYLPVPMAIAALFIVANTWEQPEGPSTGE